MALRMMVAFGIPAWSPELQAEGLRVEGNSETRCQSRFRRCAPLSDWTKRIAAVAAAAAAGTGAVLKNKTAGAVDQKINQCARAANIAAARAQRLAERAHLDFDPIAHAEFLREAAAIFADEARWRALRPPSATRRIFP